MTNKNFEIFYDSSCEETKRIVLTETMINRLNRLNKAKKKYKSIDLIDCRTGKVDTVTLDYYFRAKKITIEL